MNDSKPNNEIIEQIPDQSAVESKFQAALDLIDDELLKKYLYNLTNMEIAPLPDSIKNEETEDTIRLCKINELVYNKDEFSIRKLTSIINGIYSYKCSLFMLINSNGQRNDIYLGVYVPTDNDDVSVSNVGELLCNSIKGQFSGSVIENCSNDEIQSIMKTVDFSNISIVSAVANSRDKEIKTNDEFIQSIEKFVLSMQGKSYSALILAKSMDSDAILEIRSWYEQLYTSLSPYANVQMNTSTQTSETISHTISLSHSTSESKNKSISKDNAASRVLGGVSVGAATIGAALSPFTEGISFAIGHGVAAVAGFAQQVVKKSESKGDTNSNSDSEGTQDGTTSTTGTSSATTLTLQNKIIVDYLSRIDKQLKRIDEYESLGMWQLSAFFMAAEANIATMAASSYKSIVSGEDTGIQASAINNWYKNNTKTTWIAEYVKHFNSPVFMQKYNGFEKNIKFTSDVFVSSNELAISMALPKNSVVGLPVIEHSEFGKEVFKYSANDNTANLHLGSVYDMGKEKETTVDLDVESLSMHTFITGSTGSGKSNTVYHILKNLKEKNIKFLVVEPAKGEYKNVKWDSKGDVCVYGTNSKITPLLRINPFSFPEEIHIFEHVDRLIEIFNVCWPMYAAMPAVLKDAVLRAYERCGWDLINSTNSIDNSLFPTFADVCSTIREVIDESEYSADNKSDYIGSLETRIKSLANGINGMIFTSNEISNEELFDNNVIVDLSRIGSMETKSLIMGILVMKLNEYRMSNSTGSNQPLKHITVLEEAHNILKRTSTEQSTESANVAGKSVEMISNSIAEMRTYGEGFIIVDQSPDAVDISAIRNTNTKIIMRLPDEADRQLAGKSAGLNDEQIDEISKLRKGVAVVYQNDWVEAVLCKIDKADITEENYEFNCDDSFFDEKKFKTEYIKLLLTPIKKEIEVDVDYVERSLLQSRLETSDVIFAKKLINQYKNKKLDGGIALVYDKVTKAFISEKKLTKLVNNSKLEELNDIFADVVKRSININEIRNLDLLIYSCFMRAYAISNRENKDYCLIWQEITKKGGLDIV